MGLAPSVTVYDSAYAFTVQPNNWISRRLDDSNSNVVSAISFAYLNLSQYEVHGLFEFSYLYNNFHGPHTMGADIFSVFYKLAAFLFRLPGFENEVSAAEPNSGVYTTFFGPLFIDFGWFGPILMLFFGIAVQRLWVLLRRGVVEVVPLYLYLAVVLFLAPVVNMISGAEGLLTISSFALYVLAYRLAVPQGA
jgi:oligosaccharide repeat unit polymerase